MKGGGTDGGQEKGIGRKRGGGARAKTTTRVNENIDRRARPREKRLACSFPRGRGGERSDRRGARDGVFARGRGGALARGPVARRGRRSRARGGLGTVARGGSFGWGGGLGAAAATRIISTRRAPFWIEKPSRDPRKARGCGGASRRAGFRERASRARRDARGRTSGWAFARTTVRTRRVRPPRAKAERAGTRTPPLVKPEPRLAALLAGAATGAMPATAETAWLAMVRRCENRREGLRGKCVTPGRSSRRGALRSTVSSKCARRCTRARAQPALFHGRDSFPLLRRRRANERSAGRRWFGGPRDVGETDPR